MSSMYRSMPRRNIEGQVSLAKWPTVARSPASPWDIDESTAHTVSKLNSYFGFRPPTGYAKSTYGTPDETGYSPDITQLSADHTPELRHDTPSEVRTRTSSFGPETPPTKFDPSFTSDPHVQPLTPARHGPSHLRSYSDGCNLQSFRSDRAGSETADYDYKRHSHAALMPQAEEGLHRASSQEPASPHHNYTVNLTRDNRAVTLCLTSGGYPNRMEPSITCYRQTYLPLGGQYAEFFKASEALSLLQHMVNAPSQPFVPFSRRERADLMLRMRNTPESMVLGDPCSNARAWTSFFAAELSAGRAWEAGTVIFPWAVLQKLMNSLNSELGDHNSVSSASPPPRTPTDPHPPARIQFMRERGKSPLSLSAGPIRRRRQNSEPVRRLSLSPPRIALLKSNPCRQNLRRLAAASTPARLVFYDSIRSWPASSHRSRVRLPPCSKFLELTADQGTNPHNPIVL
uniref:Uncharacterized protein n=1 Tax=Colletotrichum fructicola (strain Nara gc5) TaxID=1213859 RepID=L2FIL5_COLFN